MWPYDPGFPNEQRALYQTIRSTREALSGILRVVVLVVVPPSHIVNMVNDMRNEEMTLLAEDDSGDPPGPKPHVRKCLLII